LIHAAFNGSPGSENRTYFFGEEAYRRYNWDSDTLDDGGSLPIFAWHLPPDFHTGIQAALNGVGSFDQQVYFFKGSEYVRYNWQANRVDFGPASTTQLWRLPDAFAAGPDGVLNGAGDFAGKAYFFKGD
jgi:hypothetical protein